jgi:predicted transcriptional regulator
MKPSDKGSASRNRAERFGYEGQQKTLSELEAITGIKRATLRYRLQILRLPIEQALKLKV